MNDTRVHPVAGSVLIRRDEGAAVVRGIWRPAGLEDWPWTGTVLEVAPGVDDPDVVAGARVLFKPRGNSALWVDDRESGQPESWRRVVRLPLDHVLGIIEEE